MIVRTFARLKLQFCSKLAHHRIVKLLRVWDHGFVSCIPLLSIASRQFLYTRRCTVLYRHSAVSAILVHSVMSSSRRLDLPLFRLSLIGCRIYDHVKRSLALIMCPKILELLFHRMFLINSIYFSPNFPQNKVLYPAFDPSDYKRPSVACCL